MDEQWNMDRNKQQRFQLSLGLGGGDRQCVASLFCISLFSLYSVLTSSKSQTTERRQFENKRPALAGLVRYGTVNSVYRPTVFFLFSSSRLQLKPDIHLKRFMTNFFGLCYFCISNLWCGWWFSGSIENSLPLTRQSRYNVCMYHSMANTAQRV